MIILIIGATGTMGKPLTKLFSKKDNWHVVAIARKIPQNDSFDSSVEFCVGDAYDVDFMTAVLDKYHYDAIVDFMWRDYHSFTFWYEKMCASTDQYIVLSTTGVYANSDEYISEDSPRYIDDPSTTDDASEYHIEKARIEDYVTHSKQTNWTIVRPHMIFSEDNLRIGIYYQDVWLYRCMNNRTTIMPRDMLEALTSYSYAGDIAKEFEVIIGNKNALQQSFILSTPNITNTVEVIDIVSKKLQAKGYCFRIAYLNNSDSLCRIVPTAASRIKKDRVVNRKMDVSKIIALSDNTLAFSDWKTKFEECIDKAISNMSSDCYKIVHLHAWMDRIAHEKTPLRELRGKRNKIVYFFARWGPSIYVTLKILRWFKKK